MRTTTILKLTVSLLFLNILLSSSTLINNSVNFSHEVLPKEKNINENAYFESPQSSFDPPYESEYLSNYSLAVELHEDDAIVEGNLTVDYYNNDSVSFDQIPFHLYPSGMSYDERPGNITIFEVKTLEGPQTPLEFEVISSEQLMWINLSEPLNSTERISFYIHFNTTLPDGGIDRSNYHGTDGGLSKIFKFAVAYPMPAVYDEKDGWNIDPYLNIGDPFYSDMAYYDFFVEVPTGFVVAATGELMETTINSDTITYHYDPHLPVRELTFSASKYFICESILVNNVNMSTFYLPKSQEYWDEFALNVTVQAVTLYNSSFGPYPYTTFNVVEEYTHYGGMEHPLQVYITESIYLYGNPTYYLELIIAHETGHQWFYHLVGNDEIDAGFLDEGLVCWATDFYFDNYYPEWNRFENYYLQSRVRDYFSTTGRPNKINISVYECDDYDSSKTDYWYVAYSKAPMILQKLRVFLGNEDYLNGIKLFFNRFQFKNAWLSDLQESFEDVYGKSLDWYFQPWFNNIYLPKYYIYSPTYDTNSSLLSFTIKDYNENDNDYPYSQQVTLEVYDNESNSIFNEIIWINGTTSLSLNLVSTPDRIKLIYTDNVLVQTVGGKEYYENNGIEILGESEPPVKTKPKIAGMPFIAIYISFSIGIILILIRMRNKKN